MTAAATHLFKHLQLLAAVQINHDSDSAGGDACHSACAMPHQPGDAPAVPPDHSVRPHIWLCTHDGAPVVSWGSCPAQGFTLPALLCACCCEGAAPATHPACGTPRGGRSLIISLSLFAIGINHQPHHLMCSAGATIDPMRVLLWEILLWPLSHHSMSCSMCHQAYKHIPVCSL